MTLVTTNEKLLDSLGDETHLWFCRHDEIKDELTLDEYRALLSEEESARQQRFSFSKDQHCFLVSHALVRKVLSKYCGLLPEQWLFDINEHGKPDISPTLDTPPVKFNLSHTDGLSVCAVTLGEACGVDVENIHRQNKLQPIAQRMFAESELEAMRNMNDDALCDKFFEYWTLREAYVKALGSGLRGSSKQFYFDIAEQDEASPAVKLCFSEESSDEDVNWQFALLKPSEEHRAAIAVKSQTSVVKKIVSQQIVP